MNLKKIISAAKLPETSSVDVNIVYVKKPEEDTAKAIKYLKLGRIVILDYKSDAKLDKANAISKNRVSGAAEALDADLESIGTDCVILVPQTKKVVSE